MESTTTTQIEPPVRKKLFSNGVFGVMIFVYTEIMLFMGFISAYLVIRASNPLWAIPPDVRLPIYATGFNTLLLLISGFLLLMARRAENNEKYQKLVFASSVLGFFFVVLQGFEWISLIEAGLSMYTGIFGALFFMIIGFHAIHAFSGALLLAYTYTFKKVKNLEYLRAVQIYWFFVVGIWPILYYLVYF